MEEEKASEDLEAADELTDFATFKLPDSLSVLTVKRQSASLATMISDTAAGASEMNQCRLNAQATSNGSSLSTAPTKESRRFTLNVE